MDNIDPDGGQSQAAPENNNDDTSLYLSKLLDSDFVFKKKWESKNARLLEIAKILVGHELPDDAAVALLRIYQKRTGSPKSEDPAKALRFARATYAVRQRGEEEAGIPERLRQLNGLFGLQGPFEITKILMYPADKKEYEFQFANGEIGPVGNVNNLDDQREVWRVIMDAVGEKIPEFNREEWQQILYLIVHTRESAGEDVFATDRGTIKEWLLGYIDIKQILPEWDSLDQSRLPFLDKGDVCIFLDKFRWWIMVKQGERIRHRKLGIMMNRAGAGTDTVKTRSKSTLQVWRLPHDLYPPPDLAPRSTIKDRAEAFFAAELDFESGARISAGDLHEAYDGYCKRAGVTALSNKELATQLKDKRCKPGSDGATRFWLGVRLRPSQPGILPS